MHLDWSTLALQTVNFAILVWLLHRFLYRPVLRVVDARRGEVEKQYADARAADEQARHALAEIAAEREKIAAERRAAMATAAAQAQEAAEARRAQAEKDAAAIVEEGHRALAQERAAAVVAGRRAALDLGMEVARRLLDAVPAQLRAEAWLEGVEQHLAEMTPEDRAALGHGLDGHALRVTTATPLTPEMTEIWRQRLDSALGDHAEIVFQVDPALVAGVELSFPEARLRFSWRGALEDLKAEIESRDDAG